jgi:hypothetical protein
MTNYGDIGVNIKRSQSKVFSLLKLKKKQLNVCQLIYWGYAKQDGRPFLITSE